MKKIIAGFLCLVMLFSLCACGKDGDKKVKNAAEITLETDIETPGYTRETLGTPYPEITFQAAVGTGDSIVLCGFSNGENGLYRMDTADYSFTPIECADTVPGYIETLDGLSDGRAVLGWHDKESAFIVCEIGADDKASVSALVLPKELEDAYILDLKVTGDGYLMTAYEGRSPCLYAVNRRGDLLSRSLYEGDSGLSLVRGRDDSLMTASYNDEGTVFRTLDSKLTVSAEYSVKTRFGSFLSGGDSGEVIGVLPLGKACVVRPETGKMRGYANLSAGKVNPRGVVPLAEGEIFCIDDGQPTIWRESGEQAQIILKLQTNLEATSMFTQQTVNAFNSTNGKYFIELADYGVYGEQAETMLLADLMNGKTPDIFDLNATNAGGIYKNNLLEDLKPYFDADSDIAYEDIVGCVRRLTQREGAVYELIPQFSVYTMFAPASLVGEGSFTMEDFFALSDEYGGERLFGKEKTGERLLTEALVYCDDFFNYREGICRFDSPEFIKLLEIAKAMPTEITGDMYNDVYHGDALLLSTWVESLGEILSITGIDAMYRGDWRCVGFPSAEGGRATLVPDLRFGMAANSQNKEGVWEFFKYLLSNGYQWNMKYDFPAVSRVLEQRMDAEIQLGWTKIFGNVRINEKDDGLEIGPPTEEQKQQTLELLDTADRLNELNPAVLDMVMNEAARFFAGGITAEQAAANIQSRASIYLSEQYG